MTSDELDQAVEIIKDRFYFVSLSSAETLRLFSTSHDALYFNIDSQLVYEPFYADFGPLNLGLTYLFCQKASSLLQEGEQRNKRVYYCTGTHPHQRANAAVLVGIFQVVFLQRSADQAYAALRSLQPAATFRDASCGAPSFHLTALDCIRGISRAKEAGFIDWDSPTCRFNVEEYAHYEQVEHGDLNWIVPGKLLAFSGPSAVARVFYGYKSLVPEDYDPYFRARGVTSIVRLNRAMYEAARFTRLGYRHHDLYFPDGSCPSELIRARFLRIVEAEEGALAVHCKAGLGRTGVLICCYMIKHHGFTPQEAIGYIRICRPGSVIGPQQNYLLDSHTRLVHEGQLFRQQQQSQVVPSVAPHLERMQPPVDTKPAAAQRAAGLAGSLMKLSERPSSATAARGSVRAAGSVVRRSDPLAGTAAAQAGGRLLRSMSLSSNKDSGSSDGGGSSSGRISTTGARSAGRLANFLAYKPFGRSTLASQPSSAAAAPPLRSNSRPSITDGAAGSGSSRAGPGPLQAGASGLPSGAAAPRLSSSGSGSLTGQGSGQPGVTRTLAANGQPRKVPTALLQAGKQPGALPDGELGLESQTSWRIGASKASDPVQSAAAASKPFSSMQLGRR